MPFFRWMRLDLVFLMGTTAAGGVFWGVCDLMILGSLSANGWGCVPVLLVVWHRVLHPFLRPISYCFDYFSFAI